MNTKVIRFADAASRARRPEAGPRFRFADSPSDAGSENGGKTLVQTFPRGTYQLLTEYGGRVLLYRYDDPSADLGNVGLGLGGSTEEAARGNLSKAAREGFAAAADAASGIAKIKALNKRFADHYGRK